MTSQMPTNAVDLYWLPVGAGDQVARRCVPIYEAVAAARQHRDRCDLYHAALEVHLDAERYVIEFGGQGRDRTADTTIFS